MISIFFTAVIVITYSVGLAVEYGNDGPYKHGFYDCIDCGDYADSECRYGGIYIIYFVALYCVILYFFDCVNNN